MIGFINAFAQSIGVMVIVFNTRVTNTAMLAFSRSGFQAGWAVSLAVEIIDFLEVAGFE